MTETKHPMLKAHTLAIAGVAAVLMLAGAAMAQQPPPPRTPAPAAQQPMRAPAPTAPGQIELPQSTTATYGNWVVLCQTRAGPPVEKVCDMAQVTQQQGSGAPFSRVAIGRTAKGQAAKLIVQVPVNASFAANVRVQVGDGDAGIAAPFARCLPSGCFVDFELKDDVLKKFRASSAAGKLTFADAGGHDVEVPISFNGFAQAFDALARE
jgi:invasion protein IalB